MKSELQRMKDAISEIACVLIDLPEVPKSSKKEVLDACAEAGIEISD